MVICLEQGKRAVKRVCVCMLCCFVTKSGPILCCTLALNPAFSVAPSNLLAMAALHNGGLQCTATTPFVKNQRILLKQNGTVRMPLLMAPIQIMQKMLEFSSMALSTVKPA